MYFLQEKLYMIYNLIKYLAIGVSIIFFEKFGKEWLIFFPTIFHFPTIFVHDSVLAFVVNRMPGFSVFD